jgi:uncharacterized membrane protein YcaP (DUF421 family)
MDGTWPQRACIATVRSRAGLPAMQPKRRCGVVTEQPWYAMTPEIIPFDPIRMFFGDAPPGFLAEIVLRTIIIYVYTLVLLRWIGGRSIAQLSVVEFLLVIALGSAVGDAMFYADVPLLHALVVITVVVLIDKVIDVLVRRSSAARQVIAGRSIPVVDHGRILTEGVLDRGISGPELMEMLRLEGVENLGEVRSAYLEASGRVSVFRYPSPRPGLPINPPHDVRPPSPPEQGEPACCAHCGAPSPHPTSDEDSCERCSRQGRAAARLPDVSGSTGSF